MSQVHLLWHVRSDDEHSDDSKLLGVYSSETSAKVAIERVEGQPGFVDHPNGFQVVSYEIDNDSWSEGFVNA